MQGLWRSASAVQRDNDASEHDGSSLQIAGLVQAPNGYDNTSEDGSKGTGEELETSDGFPWPVQRFLGAAATRSPDQPEDHQPDAKEKEKVTE
jgi:hypothetical protein